MDPVISYQYPDLTNIQGGYYCTASTASKYFEMEKETGQLKGQLCVLAAENARLKEENEEFKKQLEIQLVSELTNYKDLKKQFEDLTSEMSKMKKRSDDIAIENAMLKKRVEGSVLPPVTLESDLTVTLKIFLTKWLRDDVDWCIQNKMDENQRTHRHVLDLPPKFESLDWETVTAAITEIICDNAYTVMLPLSGRVTRTCAVYEFSW